MTESIVSKTKLSPYMKHWWNLKLTQLRTKTQQLGRKAYAKRNEPVYEAHSKYKMAHNKYANTIKKSQKDHREDFLE